MGESRVPPSTARTPIVKTLLAAAAIYQELYADPNDGSIPATFQVIYLTGWSPHDRSSGRSSAVPRSSRSRTSTCPTCPTCRAAPRSEAYIEQTEAASATTCLGDLLDAICQGGRGRNHATWSKGNALRSSTLAWALCSVSAYVRAFLGPTMQLKLVSGHEGQVSEEQSEKFWGRVSGV